MVNPLYYSIAALTFLVVVLGIGLAVLYARWKAAEDELVEADLEARTYENLDGGKLVELDPPQLQFVGRGGLLPKLFGLYSHYRKERKLQGKGYVKWLLVDDGWPLPKFVQPVEDDAAGIPYVEYDGVKYLFPKNAMFPDEQTGLWTAIHRKGEADPLKIAVPNELAIPTGVLWEYLQRAVTADEPSGLGFSLPGKKVLLGALVVLVFLINAAVFFMNGGSL